MSGPGAPPPVIEEEWQRRYPVSQEVLKYPKYHNAIGRKLDPGTDIHGNQYTRHLDYEPGAEELLKIVGGLQRGVKQVNGTQTLQGAKNWIARNKKKNWFASEGDITGPGGVPDGIPEVYITDRDGNLKVINGYALADSTYPWKKAYYSNFPGREAQLKNPYTEWKHNLLNETQLKPNKAGQYVYEYAMPKGYGKLRDKDISPMQQYRKHIFSPVYKLFKDIYSPVNPETGLRAQTKYAAMDLARINAQIFKMTWNTLIVYPAIMSFYGYDEKYVVDMREKEYKKLIARTGTKDAIRATLNEYLSSDVEITMLFIFTAWQIALRLVINGELELNPNAEVLGIKISQYLSYDSINAMRAVEATIGPIAQTHVAEIINGRKPARDAFVEARNKRIKDRMDAYNAAHANWTGNTFSKDMYGHQRAGFGQSRGYVPDGLARYITMPGAH